MAGFDTYSTPLDGRYASEEMKKLFSARSRHSTWRQLWLWLAESEKELGISSISDAALQQMKDNLVVTDEQFKRAAIHEKAIRHDVMAHVATFGEAAPDAEAIIHLGATSCYVTDNSELILMRNGLDLLLPKLAKVLSNLSKFAMEHKDLPTLGYTHYQPAQMITVGKRAAYWAEELMMDLDNLEHVRKELKFRGAQGTTGTQASFMEIFDNDAEKCDRLNELLCKKAGFPACYDISVQTYTRKVDLNVANAVCGLGATVQRITSDIRHLANMKEMEEPFEKDQIGSSAMAYKRALSPLSHILHLRPSTLSADKFRLNNLLRCTISANNLSQGNPMRSERIASLGRKLAALPANFAATFSSQWMER